MFTITHLLDVAVLVLLTKYVLETFDPGPYMLAAQRFGAIGLVGLSAYLCLRAYIEWKKGEEKDFSVRRFDRLPGPRDVLAGFFA